MLTIWGRRNSLNVQKVMWAVGEMGLAYDRKDVAGSFGDTNTDAYYQLNPNRRVPTIDDGGFILWESNACVRYLAAKYGAGNLWPADLQTRARADQWMDWLNTTLYPVLSVPFMALVRTPTGQRNQAAFDAGVANLGELYGILDENLARHPYVAGEDFSMGDIPIGCATWRYYNLEIERPTLPHVEAWYHRLLTRSAYQKHVAFPFGSTPEEWIRLEKEGAGQ